MLACIFATVLMDIRLMLLAHERGVTLPQTLIRKTHNLWQCTLCDSSSSWA